MIGEVGASAVITDTEKPHTDFSERQTTDDPDIVALQKLRCKSLLPLASIAERLQMCADWKKHGVKDIEARLKNKNNRELLAQGHALVCRS